ncbi:ER oligosaccharyltransferase complex subunit [Lodderomyces elongisporus]|uniref:ER oligosaccharyltransferase complex subunit n=1 Tax=Lodderomyces elongisporus TaxID=36914 RepID=UPI002920DA80|nr:ER oligosaccharyltransferase complex subunit [Lodderomyces elongisporus]WLF79785.1 ER oligosaccharyltransferase complex subunit [Lodderomyces elongisporus]
MADPHLGYIIPIANSDISILDGKRDYYTLITITSTNPQHGCLLCQEITPVLAKVSKLWHADYSASNFLHFVTVDLNDDTNKPIFRSLNVGTVPHIWMVPPSSVNENRENRESGESDEENRTKFDFHSVPFDEFAIPKGSQHQQVLALAKFIGHHTQHTLMIRDENAMEKFIKTFIVVFSVVVLIKKKGPEMITSVPKRMVICFLAIIAILLFTAGYQFTVQNQVPFIAKSNKGEVVFISGGMQYQFAVEVAIVARQYQVNEKMDIHMN